jgi:hypothetical protein
MGQISRSGPGDLRPQILLSSIIRQIEKHAILARTQKTGVNGAVWHFVATDRSGTIGADPRVLDLLEENGIGYVIHLPWSPTQR